MATLNWKKLMFLYFARLLFCLVLFNNPLLLTLSMQLVFSVGDKQANCGSKDRDHQFCIGTVIIDYLNKINMSFIIFIIICTVPFIFKYFHNSNHALLPAPHILMKVTNDHIFLFS